MTMRKNAILFQQRSFWLRCFLGAASIFAIVSQLSAKVQPQGPIHLWSLHGFYMNAAGKPIENAELTLENDGAVRYTTKTDAAGRFAFEHVHGRYTLHIEKSSNYSQLSREVIVGLETATLLRKNTLFIVAGPGACTDDCSSVFTNKYDYETAIRRNTQHN